MRDEDKLEQFTNDIMTNAATKRQQVLAGVDKDIEKQYKEQESILYAKAYDVIEDGMKKIEREKNELVSKAVMDNRIQMFRRRTKIIDEVFEAVRDQLRAFTKGDDYYDYLVKMIKEDLAQLEDGPKEIIINFSDEQLKEKLEKEFDADITVENKHLDFVGGCKIVDKAHGLFVDDSFESDLVAQREGFIQYCNINVE